MEKQPLNTPKQWDIKISVLKNPLLWFQLLMVALVASSYLMLLMVGINLFERHWEDIPASLGVGSVVGGGLFIALSLVLFVMHWGGIPTKYVLKDKHIEQHTLAKGKKTAGLLSLFGILSGKSAAYTAAGATLLATSRELIAVEWKEATSLEVFPKRNEIQLHNEWRTVMQVICPENQFDNILQFIQQKTEKNRLTEKVEEQVETPFVKKVMLSIFSLTFGVFLFPRLPIHYVGAFAIATIIFAFMALWSSGLKQQIFAWILFILPIIGVALAFIYGEVEMSRQGAVYALLIELLIFGFFLFIGMGIILRIIR